ncbi:spheroidene monooxygenase [Algoriphagus winogradskyi]|uniref:Spheroidene monooxygenase n=1 Tax=Algoriphagus winogradskyi TaxID=237017 RepID=A0ABY1P408_9BACT|nr:spheroidene monooxygenase [Algoriphagus winogradskyi]SMP25878.1 spheroidene monooxygenase [Algoriphagus winogradskyi]
MSDQAISQVSTVTLLRFQGSNAFWIFAQMPKAPKKFEKVSGLKFFKLMGSGGKNGFSKMLNVNIYALHCVWDSEEHANDFFQRSTMFSEFKNRTTELFTIFLKATRAHGLWSGSNPYQTQNLTPTGPIAVITRARIKLKFLPKFWSKVPSLGKKVDEVNGSIYSIGIGEYPWFMQATFSIWESYEAMHNYAYGNPLHLEVIKKTRELGWYAEELFANFIPYKTEGTWGKLHDQLNGKL